MDHPENPQQTPHFSVEYTKGFLDFYRKKLVLLGLLLGNLIDLDHIYFRLIGKVGWFDSACPSFGMQCSFGFYPLHNWYITLICLGLSALIFSKNKYFKISGWIFFGGFLNLLLDYIHLLLGFGI